jgi:hypothetical protein
VAAEALATPGTDKKVLALDSPLLTEDSHFAEGKVAANPRPKRINGATAVKQEERTAAALNK